MSQSTSISGGTSTFLDGHVRNTGDQTLTGITVQVLFPNDEGQAPAIQTVPALPDSRPRALRGHRAGQRRPPATGRGEGVPPHLRVRLARMEPASSRASRRHRHASLSSARRIPWIRRGNVSRPSSAATRFLRAGREFFSHPSSPRHFLPYPPKTINQSK